MYQRTHHQQHDEVSLVSSGAQKVSQRVYVEALEAMRHLLLNACPLCQQALVADLSLRNDWPPDRLACLVLLEDRLRHARKHKVQ
jgi:hypothetical protein